MTKWETQTDFSGDGRAENYALPSITKIFRLCGNDLNLSLLMLMMRNGAQTYSDLKAMLGLTGKHQSGRFAYYLRKLHRAHLVRKVGPGQRTSQTRWSWELSEEGKIIVLTVEQLTRPNSPIVQTARLAPALIETLRKVKDAMGSVDLIYQSLPTTPIDEKPRFALPRMRAALGESEGLRWLKDEEIKRRKAEADARYFDPPASKAKERIIEDRLQLSDTLKSKMKSLLSQDNLVCHLCGADWLARLKVKIWFVILPEEEYLTVCCNGCLEDEQRKTRALKVGFREASGEIFVDLEGLSELVAIKEGA